MIIEILCNDGSPLGVTTSMIWGDENRIGVGGAELALLTMCDEWAKAGHQVILYNDPLKKNNRFEQRQISQFNPNNKRDVLIIFRSPNIRSIPVDGYKVWWSCDQYTSGDFKEFSSTVDKIVGISPFHVNYFQKNYGVSNMVSIDLPVRVEDYDSCKVEKVDNRFIFNSVPDRGLHAFWRLFGAIQKRIPDASVTITSDYRLWGAYGPLNEKHRSMWIAYDNVSFLGAVTRDRLILEQMKAQINLYPCTYEELFCIAVAENQYAGVYPVTTAAGALETTNMGTIFHVNPDDPRNDITFVRAVLELLENKEVLKLKSEELKRKAYERFNPKEIISQWDEIVFKHG